MAVILTRRNMSASSVDRGSGNSGDENTLGGATSPHPHVSAQPDDDVTRILKMVPGEASAAYTASLALGAGGTGSERYLPLVAFVLCALLVPLLLYRDGKKYSPPIKPERKQYAFQLLAFTAWAFSIKNPLDAWGLTLPQWMPALAILFIPLFGGLLMLGTGSDTGQDASSDVLT